MISGNSFTIHFVAIFIAVISTTNSACGLTILSGTQTNNTVSTGNYTTCVVPLDGDDFMLAIGNTTNLFLSSWTKNVASNTRSIAFGASLDQQIVQLNATTSVAVGSKMYMRIFLNSDTTSDSSNIKTNLFSSPGNTISSVSMARLGNVTTSTNRFFVVWTPTAYCYGQIFTGDGSTFGAQITFAATYLARVTSVYNPSSSSWLWMIVRQGGGFTIINSLGVQILNSTLTNVGTEFDVEACLFGDDRIGVASVVGNNIMFQILDSEAGTVMSPFAVNYNTTSIKADPAVTALKGGGFVVAWTDREMEGNYGVYGNIVNANGSRAFSEDVRFSDNPVGKQQYPVLGAFSSGSGNMAGVPQFVAAWWDENNTNFKIVNLPSVSPTPRMTPSITPSTSVSPSRTPTPSLTPSVTPSSSVTPSPSVTSTPSRTASPSLTPTPSVTPSLTPTPSVTPSESPTSSITPSASVTPNPSISPSNSPTASATASSTPSVSPSVTSSSTPSTTPSITPTPSVTPSVSATSSITPTSSPTSSITPSATSTPTTPTPSPSAEPQSHSKRNSVIPAVVGSVLGGAVLAAMIAVVLMFVRKRNQRNRSYTQPSEPRHKKDEAQEMKEVNNSDSGHYSTPIQDSNNNTSNYAPIATQVVRPVSTIAERMDKEQTWSINYSKLTLDKEIGKGAFGVVYKGKWKGVEVAVKQMLNSEASSTATQDFLSEAKLMMKLRPHLHITQMMGVCTDPLCLVTEFVHNGSLLDALKKDKIQPENWIKIARGIAAGMFYLHSEGVIHRDLAARNILLDKTWNPKVSDFGMSRVAFDSAPNQTTSDVGPIRWMAPEAMRQRVYNQKTDVWSYAIVLYELLTGKVPYNNYNLMQVAASVMMNEISVLPEIEERVQDYPGVIVQVMKMCLQFKPEGRPTFAEIVEVYDLNDEKALLAAPVYVNSQ